MGQKTLFLIMSIIICISTTFATTQYEFKIIIDHEFTEDEVTCDLIYDDYEDTLVFDDNSDEDDFEIIEQFTEFLEFDCDEDLERIRLYIYNEDDERIFKETYEDEDKFKYELELVDKTETWFEIELDDDFTIENDCDLRIDGERYRFTFTEDDEIAYNYEDEFTFECDEEIERISLRVYDDDEEEVFNEKYYDTDYIEFEKDDLLAKNELRIEIEHRFDTNDEIDCELEIDNDDKFEFTFNEDSSSNDMLIVKYFKDSFIFDCDDELDEITLRIYDDLGDRIETKEYEDEDEIEYELQTGIYDFLFEITNNFNDEVRCELFIDDRGKEKLTFNEKSGISDKRIENDFNKNITLECEEKLEKVELYIFESTFKNDGELLDKYTYEDKSTINLIYLSEEEKAEQELIEQKEKEKEAETNNNTSSEPQNQNITQNIDEDNLIENGNLQNISINASAEEIAQNQNETNQTGITEDSKKMKSFGTVLFIIFLLIVIGVLLAGAIKAKNNAKKRKPSHRQKVDLEYLKKRK